MEVGVQRTDSQRLQANGPRVSFNRDVHVKRIGTRPNETENYPVQTTNLQPPQQPTLRRELPKDLSDESILKEAALVLAQAERIKCTADAGSERHPEKSRSNKAQKRETPIPNKFHSLPSRKKNQSKPISRSVSDASSKKPKKPSIFNIFSRKSDSNLDQIGQEVKSKDTGTGKKISRSKSDASGSASKDRKTVRKRTNSENEDPVVAATKPAQLSPIIENTQREDYFEESPKGRKVIGASKNESGVILGSKSSPITSTPIKVPPGNIGFTSHEDLDLIPAKPVGETIKGRISSLAKHSRSLEDMHSSQLPPEKPPLTKGLTVDGMVKRLSMERFSPPPHISGPAFSYTRPNDQVIYAQVVCEADGKLKQTVRSPYDSPKDMDQSYRPEINGFHRRSPIDDSLTRSRKSELPSHNYTNNNNNKSEVYINENFDSRYRSYSPQQQVTRIRGPTSPHPPWKQSPRNLSDEDEGLGFEPRKYFEEEIPVVSPKVRENRNYTPVEYDHQRRSPTEEPPIVPVIRSLSPIDVRLDVANRGRADGMDSRKKDPFSDEFHDLSYRREALESKIRSRRIGSVDPYDQKSPEYQPHYSPERIVRRSFEARDYHDDTKRDRYLSPEPDTLQKFHKLNSREILDKYSPERTHLDMVAPGREVKTSRYVQRRYFDDGTGGVKETYQRETHVDEHGKPHVRESRRRERLDSPRRQHDAVRHYDRQDHHYEDKYRLQEYEPKSLDSQFSEMNRSSPENIKRGEYVMRKQEENWQDSLKRDKRQQRSFDKGDSGIENDFRKESFNGELTSKWRKRTYKDDIKSCELFIKKERRHTEEQHPQRKKYDFVFRERSIDDGSHFDPRLDKYPKGTLRKKNEIDRYSSPPHRDLTLKKEKKVGGLEKMKQLFGGGSKKKDSKELNGKAEPGKDGYMVREEEMRNRYHEYRGVAADLREPPNVPDISTRRRLSTPKASPIPKRTFSQKSPKPSPLALQDESTQTKAEKSGWFKSLDRLSKKKSKGESGSRYMPAEDEISQVKATKSYRTNGHHHSSSAQKNLRFFGDTDQESNPSISRAASNQRARPTVMTLGRNQKHSQSAYHLDRIQRPHVPASHNRSSSLQNLDEGVDEVDRSRRKHHSRSRNLDNISESASDTDVRNTSRHISAQKVPARGENRENEGPVQQKKRYYEEQIRRNSQERDSRSPLRENTDPARIEFRKPPPGPPKPARSMERRQAYSRERDRLHDSSGTEGDSSLQSQRSVVYLHATTVGAIPQPYHINPRRRAISREELSNKSKEKPQPMTKTVSRSVSMLAPWKPKHVHEGYEINYSQEAQEKPKKHSTMPRKPASGSSSKSKKSTAVSTSSRKYTSSKDDISSIRNSSITSASKSGLSTHHRPLSDRKSSSDLRKDTLNRRRVK